MPTRTNLTSTRRTVAALRKASRLAPEHAALVLLAESTAEALDEVLTGDDRRYVVAQMARAHLLAVQALLNAALGQPLDPFAAFVAGLAAPSSTDPES